MARELVHLELHTDDRPGAVEFYARLAGWQPELIESTAGRYWAFDLGCRFGGGVVECAAPRPLWLPYVEVDDVTRATELARRLGARVMLPPREGPSGWRSVVTGPASGELALWQPRERAESAARADELRAEARSTPS